MTTLLALGSIADATPEQHAAAQRVLEAAAPDLTPYVFGEPHTDNEHARMLAAQSAARRNGNAARINVTDPVQTSATGDIGPFRALVCAWGRENGWPHADSRKPLNPALLAAYRAAKPETPKAKPKPAAARQAAYFGPSAEAKALRAVIRTWGIDRGLPVHHNGSLNPRLVEAYYAAHPGETS